MMYGIMQISEWNLGSFRRGYGASYRFSCDCHDMSHDATIMFTAEGGLVQMHLYKNSSWDAYWKEDWFYKRIWLRIKAALRIIFVGYIELEDDMVLSKKQLPDLIKVLEDCLVHLDEYEKSIPS